MTDDLTLKQAAEFIKTGRKQQAKAALQSYLAQFPDESSAWVLLVRASDNIEDQMEALQQVLRIKPGDAWATKYIGKLVNKERLQRAVQLAKDGERERADSLVNQVLENDAEMVDGWILRAKLSNDREKALRAAKQALRLAPKDERAIALVAKLQGKEGDEEKDTVRPTQVLLWIGLVGVIITMIVMIIALLDPLLSGSIASKPTDDLSGIQDISGSDCKTLIEKAILISDESCRRIGSNEICYGNYRLDSEISPEFGGSFSYVGDVISLNFLKSLFASPLDLDNNIWGVAIIKVPANMPGTLPGQNVSFVIHGDTSLTNTSGDMSVFYFTSGITGIKCDGVSYDGLMVEAMDGTGMVFTANGVDFLIQGSAELSAQPGEELVVNVIDGTALITANGESVSAEPGTAVSVPLTEDLSPDGPPSEPVPVSEEQELVICQVSGVGCPTPTPGGVVVQLFTNTPVPVEPGMPTNTSVPLVTSPPGGGPAATNTSPPGGGPAATNTSPPPPPPTATLEGICSNIIVEPAGGTRFRITNNYGKTIQLNKLRLSWPVDDNGSWIKTILNGKSIDSSIKTSSPATVTFSGGLGLRKIPYGASWVLEVQFENSPASGGYSVTLTFDVGCTRSASQ